MRTALRLVKPGILGDMIEATLPGPYLELFARQPRLGWDAWGYGVETPDACRQAPAS